MKSGERPGRPKSPKASDPVPPAPAGEPDRPLRRNVRERTPGQYRDEKDLPGDRSAGERESKSQGSE